MFEINDKIETNHKKINLIKEKQIAITDVITEKILIYLITKINELDNNFTKTLKMNNLKKVKKELYI